MNWATVGGGWGGGGGGEGGGIKSVKTPCWGTPVVISFNHWKNGLCFPEIYDIDNSFRVTVAEKKMYYSQHVECTFSTFHMGRYASPRLQLKVISNVLLKRSKKYNRL